MMSKHFSQTCTDPLGFEDFKFCFTDFSFGGGLYFWIDGKVDAVLEQLLTFFPFSFSRTSRSFSLRSYIARRTRALAGYLYFHSAPDAQQFHHECISRIQNLHTSDCLRANKSTMAWGLECRVPFLDKAFLDVAMNEVPPNHKLINAAPYFHKCEKHVIREAFNTPENPYLPDEILWRQKEQFSDGVGYGWIDGLKAHAEGAVSDALFEARQERFPHDTPTTKEAYWYRHLFDGLFPEKACLESVVRWIPRRDWGAFARFFRDAWSEMLMLAFARWFLGCPEDPSGRAQKAHEMAYEKKE
jgi:asparagine synthase (glutamine-hydrolysing)